ncbi:MAG: PP2C family protein-serine/threonine phosphatase, partial [Candidatus Omnitrophota bacterium]|nr:PP2C family protein-serine/threonine phosphatase [Candidatus Omnitrophota bacterium]
MKGQFLQYLNEFSRVRIKVIRSRLRLFCLLTLTIFIATSVLSTILNPSEFRSVELYVWAFLIAAAILVLSINRKTKTLLQAKLNSSFFAASLISALAGVFLIYPEYIRECAGFFSLIMFFISFIIPWEVLETAFIGALHFLGYTILYISSKSFVLKNIFTPSKYVDGLIFLAVSLILCIIIRKRDDDREKENFILMKELEGKNAQMERELALARDIHKTLIPQSTSTENANIAVNYVPVSTVGGDYATFHVTKEGNLFFLIGDITGHGVPAALLVNRLYGEVESLIAQNPAPGILLKELDGFVQKHFKNTEMYLSVCSGLLDFKRNILSYSNYGHPPQILHQRRDNKIYLLESQTYLLGIDIEAGQSKIYEG